MSLKTVAFLLLASLYCMVQSYALIALAPLLFSVLFIATGALSFHYFYKIIAAL
jgi:hypothetical protein